MIIFKAFQGLENFYIKFQDFLYFSRICTNPDKPVVWIQIKTNVSVKCTTAYQLLLYNEKCATCLVAEAVQADCSTAFQSFVNIIK